MPPCEIRPLPRGVTAPAGPLPAGTMTMGGAVPPEPRAQSGNETQLTGSDVEPGRMDFGVYRCKQGIFRA